MDMIFGRRIAVFAIAMVFLTHAIGAGPLRDRLKERRGEAAGGELADPGTPGSITLPPGVGVDRDVAYGSDPLQRFDVYLPPHATGAPVILMVHGGGWYRGDKAMPAVVQGKLDRWVPKGFIFVSTNYRMVPAADPVEQARDVARALAAVQAKAPSWGGDPRKVILMGHSAGAHLVSLVTSDRALTSAVVSQPFLGTISLDSAGYDIVMQMEGRHFELYDRAFGTDRKLWRDASPYYRIDRTARPILAVCSSRRMASPEQSRRFASRATSLGVRVEVHEEDLSHRQINEELGVNPDYTAAVERFMASLDASVAQRLGVRR